MPEGANVVPLQQSDYDPEFSDFWTLYPRHVARKDALKAWSRLTAAERLAAIVGAAAWRPVWLQRGELEFVPYPATFIRGERWDDELPAVAVGSSAACHAPARVAAGERGVMPEHVRSILAKLRGKA